MPLNSCVRIEWKDIFLNGAYVKNTEDIPIKIEIKSLDNPSLVNSTVSFVYQMSTLAFTKSTSDNTLTTVSQSNDKLVLTTKLTPSDDLWDIPYNCKLFRVDYVVLITTPDICDFCVGAGNFYIQKTK